MAPSRQRLQQILTAGQQVAYADGVADPLHAVDSEASLAWRDGWLNYYKAPLADVLKDLERYYPGRILLLNGELGARRVSGSFPARTRRRCSMPCRLCWGSSSTAYWAG